MEYPVENRKRQRLSVGVGLFLSLAIIRIATRTDLTAMLLFFYMLLFAFSAMLIANGGQSFLPLAFDSGGVTTGPITVPFIMALGLGIAQAFGQVVRAFSKRTSALYQCGGALCKLFRAFREGCRLVGKLGRAV